MPEPVLDQRWRLDDQAAVRPEPFGALLYHFGTRRLSLVKDRTLDAVVRSLAAHPTARAACSAAGVPAEALPAYERALAALARSGMITTASPGSPASGQPARTPSSRPLEPPQPAPLGERQTVPVPPAQHSGPGPVRGTEPVPPAQHSGPRPVSAAEPVPPAQHSGPGPVRGTEPVPPAERLPASAARRPGRRLADMLERGLTAPICLTWELTYACNLQCVHCLSSSGRRDPQELSTSECRQVIDSLAEMGVFYVNIGGGEPTVRPDFWELVGYATAHRVGVKFSTNGVRIGPAEARRLAGSDYVDVQVSLDGATAEVNDAVRGAGSYRAAIAAMENLRAAGSRGFKLSVVVTRHNVCQLDALQELADSYHAQLRLTRLRPSGRGADTWPALHPTARQQHDLYEWLRARGEQVLTGDSFFHLAPYGEPLPGLGLCGAARVVCLIDPVGDVYACPFTIHEQFLAGNVRQPGGFGAVWRESELFRRLREPRSGGACASCGSFDACRGGCLAAKFFTGLPLDGPDPECVRGHGEPALAAAGGGAGLPRPAADHSRRPVPVTIGRRPPPAAVGAPGMLA